MKDSQLREIARIRNESNVEITMLKRKLDNKVIATTPRARGKENNIQTGLFIDNEEVIEKRQLV